MATKGTNTRVLVGGYLLSNQTNSADLSVTLDRIEATPFEATGQEYVTLAPDAALSLNGYVTFDAADAATYERRLFASITTADTVGVIFYPTAPAGSPSYVLPSAYTSSMEIASPVDGVMTINGSYVSDTGMRRGICVFSGTISATGATTAIDIGAAGAAGGFAYLFVTTETGSGTNGTIDIESSATEAGTYASEGTFTFSAIGVTAIALSGTVNRWLRLNCTALGGATSWTVSSIACVAGVTY